MRGRWLSAAGLQARLEPLLNESEVGFRDCRDADIEAVPALWREAGAVLRPAEDVDGLRTLLARDTDLFLLATEDERVLGTLLGSWDGSQGEIDRMVVHPEHQGRSIARGLISLVESAMRQRGVRTVTSLVPVDEPGARLLWSSLQYARDDSVGGYAKEL